MKTPKGRATTPDQKRAVLDRVYKVWLKNPELRLGQLMITALNPIGSCPAIFYTEDETVADKIEAFEAKKSDKKRP